jgi:hypothetical protein
MHIEAIVSLERFSRIGETFRGPPGVTVAWVVRQLALAKLAHRKELPGP